MIEINLLPQEFRRVERTPLPRFIIIIVGVILIVGGGLFLVNKRLDVRRANIAVKDNKENLASYKKSVDEYNKLVAEIKEIEIRTEAISSIWQSRLFLAVKLDELADLIPRYVGLSELKFDEAAGKARARQAASGGTLSMSCILASDNEKRLASFRRILTGEIPPEDRDVSKDTGRTFFSDFVGEIEDSGWKKTETKEYLEKEYLEFDLDLTLKARGAEAQPKTAAPKLAASAIAAPKEGSAQK